MAVDSQCRRGTALYRLCCTPTVLNSTRSLEALVQACVDQSQRFLGLRSWAKIHIRTELRSLAHTVLTFLVFVGSDFPKTGSLNYSLAIFEIRLNWSKTCKYLRISLRGLLPCNTSPKFNDCLLALSKVDHRSRILLALQVMQNFLTQFWVYSF